MSRFGRILGLVTRGLGLAGLCGAAVSAAPAKMERVVVAADRSHFALADSGAPFRPWGFNYDHDSSGRLLEDYWQEEWPAVAKDFAAMKALGANVVRVHLQTGKFMASAREPNRASLERLARLLRLAEQTGLYLDVTGLACYKRKDTPQWYNDLDEAQRWDTQSRFWEAVAGVCARSPAVFCYDLMNEPVAGGDGKDRDWTPGEFAGECFVQRLTLDLAGRSDKQVAKAWVDKMAAAIRQRDQVHLITVGAIPWALTWPGAKPIFYSAEAGRNLDFVSVHFYPKKGEVDKALAALAVYNVGKPVVIGEMFPLSCPVEELNQFVDGSRKIASGWIGFYWGKTIEQYRSDTNDANSALTLRWLEYFVKKTPEMSGPAANP
jgi:hypothetical protein